MNAAPNAIGCTWLERSSPWGDLRLRPRRFSPSVIFIFLGIGPCGPVPPPPLEWTSFPPLVAAVLSTPKGAESPGSRRVGVLDALLYLLPSETV